MSDARTTRRVGSALHARLELAKPGITLFLVLSAATAYLVAAGGRPDVTVLLALVFATAATVGGAAALNQIRERDLDAGMGRTRDRPLPSGRLSLAEARTVAVALSATGLGLSVVFLPWITTLLLVLGHAGYVLVYTPLKRISPLCTPVGALPGALPILAGWSVAAPVQDPQGLAIFGAIVLWQLPHFLAIGWLGRAEYRRAGLRVLPAVDGTGSRTGRWVVLSAALLLPFAVLPLVGVPVLATAAGLLTLVYLVAGLRFAVAPAADRARRLFFLSLVWVPGYLGLLLLSTLGGGR